MEKHLLSGWQIFPEKSGSTLVKLRFIPVGGDNREHDSDVVQESINSSEHFTRRSQNKIARDNLRAKKHKDNQVNSADPKVSPMHLRSRSEGKHPKHDIEEPRDTDTKSPVAGNLDYTIVDSESASFSNAPLLSPAPSSPTLPHVDKPDTNCSPRFPSHVVIPDSASTPTASTLQHIKQNGCTKNAFGMHMAPCLVCHQDEQDCSSSDDKSGDEADSDSDSCYRRELHVYSSEID